MSMYSTVSCAEVHGSIQEGAEIKTGWDCSVQLQCAWGDRHALIQDLLSNRRPWPHGGFAEPPKAHGASCAPLVTKYVEVGQSCEYTDALVTVNYSNEIKELISESLEPNAQFMTCDWRRFRWGAKNGDPILEAEAPGKLMRGMNLVRTLHELEPPLPVSLLTLQGSVNDGPYTSDLLGLTFDTETLLFQQPNLSRVIKTDGTKAFSLVLKLSFKTEGWNVFWRAKTQAYERLFDVDNGQYDNYPKEDFADFLF